MEKTVKDIETLKEVVSEINKKIKELEEKLRQIENSIWEEKIKKIRYIQNVWFNVFLAFLIGSFSFIIGLVIGKYYLR